jgi:hypothetical protein
MLAVTYGDKTYNVLVEKMSNTSQPKSQGGTRRTQSKQSTHRNKRKQNRSKPTRRIKR